MKKNIIKLPADISINASASVVGKLESEGPLSAYFDICESDMYFGQKTWEQAESELLRRAVAHLLQKARLQKDDIDVILSGDLLNQCIASGYALGQFEIPYYGLYGACSTIAEALSMSAMLVGGGYADRAIAAASSHFGSSERQFRFPVEYGGQRTPTSQRTVTGCGAFLIERSKCPPFISEVVIGKIVDQGIKDAGNMGAAMAPAAVDTIYRYFSESTMKPSDFDIIATGDLATEGYEIACELFKKLGLDVTDKYTDCGMLIYDRDKQDVHAGASGCGCSAAVLSGYLLDRLKNGANDILLVGTGALLSPLAIMQGSTIPSVAHLVHISNTNPVY